jgi:spore coat polysaccharide biosynthesis predicted glycosyltransferase SpsG
MMQAVKTIQATRSMILLDVILTTPRQALFTACLIQSPKIIITISKHDIKVNKRHRRVGHLFQNRYKAIIRQEDTYFLELIRYIHLNPIWAGLVEDMAALRRYPYSGHAYLLGGRAADLKLFPNHNQLAKDEPGR